MGDVPRFYGQGVLEQPFVLRYTRRRDRFLAIVWPPRRKRMRMMRAMVGHTSAEMQARLNRAMADMMIYGSHVIHVDHKDAAGIGDFIEPPGLDSDAARLIT